MSTVTDAIKRLQDLGEDAHVCVCIWSQGDVEQVALEHGIPLTQEQINDVLDSTEDHHDAEQGVNWECLRSEIEDYGNSIEDARINELFEEMLCSMDLSKEQIDFQDFVEFHQTVCVLIQKGTSEREALAMAWEKVFPAYSTTNTMSDEDCVFWPASDEEA